MRRLVITLAAVLAAYACVPLILGHETAAGHRAVLPGRDLAASWAGSTVFYSQVVVPELALLDTILLAALEAEVPEPAEIQTDAGIYERRGTDYRFATWAQLEEAS